MTATADPAAGASRPAAGTARSVVRYLLIGGASFAVDLAVLFAAHGLLDVPLPAATAVAHATALVLNFALNRFWSFGARARWGRQFVRYLVLVGANNLATVAAVPALAALGTQYLLAKTVVTALLTVLNYLAYRTWVFR